MHKFRFPQHSSISWLMIVVGVILCCSFSSKVLADTMNSTNYTVPADSLNVGGLRSTSTGFILEDTLGEIATGEDLTSANFRGCAGYQCFIQTPYLTFSVHEGTSAPGTPSVGVALGTLTPSVVKTSDGTAINSIFINAETNAGGGAIVTVRDAHAGLKRDSSADVIDSVSGTLVPGSEGYGICVFSVAQGGESPSSLAKEAPYNSSCNKSNNHGVGLVDSLNRPILSATDGLQLGSAEVLVKAAISSVTSAGNDYADTLTFIMTGTF